MSEARELLRRHVALIRETSQKDMIEDVIAGFLDNFEDKKFKNEREVNSMLDNLVRDGSFGEDVKSEFEDDDKFRVRMEKELAAALRKSGQLK